MIVSPGAHCGFPRPERRSGSATRIQMLWRSVGANRPRSPASRRVERAWCAPQRSPPNYRPVVQGMRAHHAQAVLVQFMARHNYPAAALRGRSPDTIHRSDKANTKAIDEFALQEFRRVQCGRRPASCVAASRKLVILREADWDSESRDPPCRRPFRPGNSQLAHRTGQPFAVVEIGTMTSWAWTSIFHSASRRNFDVIIRHGNCAKAPARLVVRREPTYQGDNALFSMRRRSCSFGFVQRHIMAKRKSSVVIVADVQRAPRYRPIGKDKQKFARVIARRMSSKVGWANSNPSAGRNRSASKSNIFAVATLSSSAPPRRHKIASIISSTALIVNYGPIGSPRFQLGRRFSRRNAVRSIHGTNH